MHKDQHIPRIPPLEPPYSSEVAAALAKWMPPGAAVEPLKLFRTLFQNREMSDRMRPLGAGILGSHSSIEARDREIVIDRVCALWLRIRVGRACCQLWAGSWSLARNVRGDCDKKPV